MKLALSWRISPRGAFKDSSTDTISASRKASFRCPPKSPGKGCVGHVARPDRRELIGFGWPGRFAFGTVTLDRRRHLCVLALLLFPRRSCFVHGKRELVVQFQMVSVEAGKRRRRTGPRPSSRRSAS